MNETHVRKARRVTKPNAYTIDPLEQIITAEIAAYGQQLLSETNTNQPLTANTHLEELNSTSANNRISYDDSLDEITHTSGIDIKNRTEITRCPCHRQSNRGLMICCETCHVWQHTDCVGLPDILPSEYYCEQCRPEGHSYFDKLMAIEEGVFELSRHSSRVNSRTNSLSLGRQRSTINSMEQVEWTQEQIEIMFGNSEKLLNQSPPSRLIDSETRQSSIYKNKRKQLKEKENIPQIDCIDKASPLQNQTTLNFTEDTSNNEPKMKKMRRDIRKSHKKLPRNVFKSKQLTNSSEKDFDQDNTKEASHEKHVDDTSYTSGENSINFIKEEEKETEESLLYDEKSYGFPPYPPCRPHHNNLKLSISGMMKRVNDITEFIDGIEADASAQVYSILPAATLNVVETEKNIKNLGRLKSSLLEFLVEYG